MGEEEKLEQKTLIIDDMTIPRKNPDVTIREELEEDGKYILYNAEAARGPGVCFF